MSQRLDDDRIARAGKTGVPDDAFDAARAVFDGRETVDLTRDIGLMNAYNRLAIGFRKMPQAALTTRRH